MSRSPAAAVRIRLFPAAAGVVAACGIAGLLPAQLPGGFHLYKWSGELGLEAERRDDRSTAANDEQLRQRETLFREALGIRTNGYAYHPALFDFEAGVRAEFDQREVETDPGDTQQYADSFRLFYDALAQILKEKPIHGDVYARRARLDTRQRFFATTTAEIATEGADLFWRDLWIPSALHYEHSRYVGEGRDTLRQSTERWRLEGTRSDERNHLGYNLEWNELDQQTFGTHYDELLASLHLGHRFGAQGAHSVTAGGTHRDRTGTQSSLYQQANGALHLQWLPELQSDHSISVDRSEIDSDLGIDVGRDGLIATSWLRHSLYESLETSLGGRYYRSDYEAGKLERRDAEFALDYHKSTSFGSIGLGYRPTVYREDEAGAGTAVPVVGESYTYTPGVPILLQSANVIATSVVVRDAALGTTFVQPADYLLVPVGPRLRIDVPVGSRIVGGTVLQIDYAYEPNPGRSYQGTSHSVALSFGFGDFAGLTLEHSTDRVRLLSGSADGNLGNSQRDAVRAWVGQWGQSLTVEYEDYDSFISSTERLRAIAMSQVEIDGDKTLSSTATWYRTRFKELDYVERGLSLVSGLQWRVSPQFTTYGRAEYHRIDYRTDSGEGYQFEAGFDYRLHKNTLTLEARYSVEEFAIASDQELLFVQLIFKRFF